LVIALDDCTITFGRNEFQLQSIDWGIEKGQVWAIVGPNGSGKSALAASLCGEGTVSVGARQIKTNRISVISLEEQESLILREKARDDSDITDQIATGTPVSEMVDEVSVNEALKRELISIFGLEELLKRGFRKLSTGETRKLLFVRALTSEPELLVLDEPYEGLDVETVPRVRDILSRMAETTTMVMVLNRIDDIPDFVTHVLRLEHGRISQQFRCDDVSSTRDVLRQIGQISSDEITLPMPEIPIEVSLNPDGTLVSMANARVAYTDNIVFEALNWQVRPGSHWQVKGPNGSGKTCLLNLITGDHPQCYVNDIAIFGFNRGQGETIWDIKRFLGFVSTSLHWDYRLSVSVRKVVVSGFYDSIGLYQKATDKQMQIASDWLRLLGLSEHANQPFSSLSYGEQRVLLIARAMIKHPPLLLLDEPCLGLDEVNRSLVLALIERICNEGETTVVYVSHHEEDKLAVIENELVLG
jgi:molybdate transport system ATP-binding protein